MKNKVYKWMVGAKNKKPVWDYKIFDMKEKCQEYINTVYTLPDKYEPKQIVRKM